MTKLISIINYMLIVLLLLFTGIGIYIYNSGPKLPKETEEIINKVLSDPLPELISDEVGYANNDGINIWYEHIKPKQESKGTVLLIMGIANDALGWPRSFINSFVVNGYEVIRFDHRGTGMSDWLEDFESRDPYSLSDMAADVVAVIDTLEIGSVHLIGVSMGGMIAQEMAINNPERVESLNSIMSSGNIFDQDIEPISSALAFDLIKLAIKYQVFNSEANMVKLHLASRIVLMGEATNKLNVEELAKQVIYNLRKRRGYNRSVSKQHQTAVYNSDSRYDLLKKVKIPTLIVHGLNDPFIPIAHSKKYLSLMPNADSLWVQNMGHDIPDEHIPLITKKILSKLAK